jgi:hypothetical protein
VDGSQSWMHSLALHFDRVRRAYPADQLLIVFDFDGTVVDQSHGVRDSILEYDRVHGTDHFHGLVAAELDAHENDLERVLAERGLPPSVRSKVPRWRSQPDSMGGFDRARPGILEVMRWFQLQPSTFVGLITLRPPRLRDETFRSLNRLGREVRAAFDGGLLHMNDGGNGATVVDSRVEGLRAFARAGYRTFAVVDSEPAVIEALSQSDDSGEILFLHARNPADRALVTPRTVEGRDFDFTALIAERDLPDQVTLVWHGVNDDDNLHQFLASQVSWGECDVRRDPTGRLVLRHDSFEATPWTRDERLLPLATAVDAFAHHDRGIKLDLKDGPNLLPEVVALLDEHRLASHRVWFNARTDVLDADAFRTLQSTYPDAIVQCPVDFLGALTVAEPTLARAVLQMLNGWGIGRFSVGWGKEHTVLLLERLQEWGYAVNLYGVPDLESFLRAVLLLPRSLTADFNFPDWNYYGRGSGERRHYHRYSPHAGGQSRDRSTGRRADPTRTATAGFGGSLTRRSD